MFRSILSVAGAMLLLSACADETLVVGPGQVVEPDGVDSGLADVGNGDVLADVSVALLDGGPLDVDHGCTTAADCPASASYCRISVCHPDGSCGVVLSLVGTPCIDGDACTVGEACAEGTCKGGVPTACDDDNPCTDEGCDPKTGCSHSPNTAPCEDNNPCTKAESCVDGACTGGAGKDCDDGVGCTVDYCDPTSGCVHLNGALACDDGDACTGPDVCVGGACAGGAKKTCDDANPCTDDSCDPETACTHNNNSAPCDDGSACTGADHCAKGACAPGKPAECDDGNPCTTSTCAPDKGCVNTKNNLPCDDGSACTTADTCTNGVCKGAQEVDCDDSNPCTDDGCELSKGCLHGHNDKACDDGNVCTTGDACALGACAGNAAKVCDDKTPCTSDWCHPTKGCQSTTTTSPCDDGNACTKGDTCGTMGCKGKAIVCDDKNVCTTDYCDAVAGCKTVVNANKCTDGDACTEADRCEAGACVGVKVSCEDNNACTLDTCSKVGGCAHGPMAAGHDCGDGGICEGGKCIGGAGELQSSCSDVRDNVPGAQSGIYWIDADGKGGAKPIQVRCEMGYGGGGWTLLLVSSDDGKATWTWQNKTLWTTDPTGVGDLNKPHLDFKSPAIHHVGFDDVLVVHGPSGVWAIYDWVGAGATPFAKRLAQLGGPNCTNQDSNGWPMSQGTLSKKGKLCSTRLYMSPKHDDGSPYCGATLGHAWGPAWSVATDGACPFSWPGKHGSLGPSLGDLTTEHGARGFGAALGLNTGAAGKGLNYLQVWVRDRPPPVCGDSFCDGAANEDCKGCPKDCGLCPAKCGDGVCGEGENCYKCQPDCGMCALICGNNVCEGAISESCASCPADCGTCQKACGDGKCELAFGETCESCAEDCGKCKPVCGNGNCEKDGGETCFVCEFDCGKCKPKDCGDGYCDNQVDKYESCSNCPEDCGKCPNLCGDGKCQPTNGELCGPCPDDCGKCPLSCFDGKCEPNKGETCLNCPHDCGICPAECGNGICESKAQNNGEAETCEDCKVDCGDCGDGCVAKPSAGCKICPCEACVCGKKKSCCMKAWTAECVLICAKECGGKCDLNNPTKP